jgi:ribose 5-phosphate isomerase B
MTNRKKINVFIFLSKAILEFSKLKENKNNTKNKFILLLENHLKYNLRKLNLKNDEYFFFIKKKDIKEYNLQKFLKKNLKKKYQIIPTKEGNPSEAEIFLVEKKIKKNEAVLIYETSHNLTIELDGLNKLLNKKNNQNLAYLFLLKSSKHSEYFANIKNKHIKKITKKVCETELSILNNYYFNNAEFFFDQFKKVNKKVDQKNLIKINNKILKKEKSIKYFFVKKFHNLYNLDATNFYIDKVDLKFGNKKIALASDHSGYQLKEQTKKILKNLRIKYTDVGTYQNNFSSNYSFYANKLAKLIKEKKCDHGLSFCRSGQGVNIAANKNDNIISALVYNEYAAKHCIEHNCANHFAIPSKFITNKKLIRIIKNLASAKFDGGRHYERIKDLIY